jgi:hypothetical protein
MRWLVAAPILAASAVAMADPVHVHVERCAMLDSDALDTAVTRELVLDPKLASHARQLAVSLECADGLHANLRIEPAPADGPLARELDLGEAPAELRVKLVALAIAELIDIEATEPAPRALAPTHSDDDDSPPRIVAQKPSQPRGPKITARAGLRVFADDQYPMASISGDLELGPVQVGLATQLGQGHRFTSIPYIVAVTVAHRVVCSDGRSSLCMVVRGEVGFAGVSIYEDSPHAQMPESIHSTYGDLTFGFELRRQFDGYKGLAGIEIGAADGLVVEALSFVHLNGPFATAVLGVQW